MDQEELALSGTVLRQLVEGTALFEFIETQELAPFASLSGAFSGGRKKASVTPCFAKIVGMPGIPKTTQRTSQALKKIEYFTVQRVAGDGRCMFRALVLGMAANKGMRLGHSEEEQEADQLRLAVMDAICKSDKRSQKYPEALIAITIDESLARYCQRIPSSNFWGGESELLVLSKLCKQPIIVYRPEAEVKGGGGWGSGYIPIAEYGSEYRMAESGRKARKPVRLLYSGSNHYDLLS